MSTTCLKRIFRLVTVDNCSCIFSIGLSSLYRVGGWWNGQWAIFVLCFVSLISDKQILCTCTYVHVAGLGVKCGIGRHTTCLAAKIVKRHSSIACVKFHHSCTSAWSWGHFSLSLISAVLIMPCHALYMHSTCSCIESYLLSTTTNTVWFISDPFKSTSLVYM